MARKISDEDLNPGNIDYDTKFNGAKEINDAESKGTIDNKSSHANDDINSAEKNPMNYTGTGSGPGQKKVGGGMAFIKKKGPITGIILTLVGGGLGMGGLLSPSLLLVQIKEVMVGKFNTQLTSMDIRTNKMLKSKMTGNFGVCGSVISMGCKYSSLSDHMIKKYKKLGIDVELDGTTKTLGRNKVKNLIFNDEVIKPKDLASKLNTDVKFRSAMKKAYNPLYSGFADSIWNKTLLKIKITEKGIEFESGSTDKEKLSEIQNTTKDPVEISNGEAPSIDDVNEDGTPKYPDGEGFEEAMEGFEEAAELADDVVEEAAEVAAEEGSKAATKTTTSELAKKFASNALGVVDVADVPDRLCMVYGSVRAVGFAAKTVRALQLARYAMIFLTMADKIKTGDANPDDVSYLGKVLTSETITKNDAGEVISKKTATDSFGYKYAAYGDLGEMPDSATQFLTGAGLTGSLIGITSLINQYLGGSPNTVCKVLNNTFVQIGTVAVGVGAAIASGGLTLTAGAAAKIAGIAAFTIGLAFLPNLLKDIVAGKLVDESTTGELAGDALTSGASSLMGEVASNGGNAPLTVEQAVAYKNLTNKIVAQYAEEDRLAYSPFDASNKNTFMGSVLLNLTPSLVKMSSLSGSLVSIATILPNALSSIFPIAKAADSAEYEMCQDIDYKNLGIAADPYCNLVYGIPSEDLDNIEPMAVLDKMSGQIDPVSGEPVAGSGYEKFVNDCMNREEPLGYTGENFQGDSGENCLINDNNPMNKYYYLYQIDQRVEKGMDEDPETSTTAASGGSADPGDSSQPENTEAAGSGWRIKNGVDYSSVPCAEGTEDQGVTTHPVTKYTIRKCSTKVGVVASIISKRTLNMVNAAAADGIALTGSGWRSAEGQIRAWNKCAPDCDGMVAKPGNSNHERGLAIDVDEIGKVGSGPKFEWLVKNAAKYGYINYWKEGWHWSTTGG